MPPSSSQTLPLTHRAGSPSRLLTGVAWASLAFWLYYAFLRQVAGPLNPDEIYFSHTIWLINQGKQQYVDFYSNHLPAYFQLLKPLVAAISTSPTDLSYVWGVRALSGVVIALYLALTWTLQRRVLPDTRRTGLLELGALLLVFVVVGRMVEVRADTIGLLLVNAAWAIVLCGRTPGRMAVAALLAGFAVLFSARAGAIVGVFGLLLLFLALRSRDWAGVRALLYVGAFFLAAGLALYAVAPEWVALVIRSCFIEPSRLLSVGMPLQARFLAPERLPLTVLVLAGLLAGLRLMRQGPGERGLVIAVACGAQVLMVLLDPAPHQYVFSWAAVPAVVGIVSVSRPFALFFPAAIAAAVLGVSIGYGALKGEAPATASWFRLTFDATLDEREIGRLPTPELVALLVSDKQQKNLASQLRVRSEVCRRLGGTTLAAFDTHPVCLGDALFYWTGVRWPPLAEGDRQAREALTHEEFGRALLAARPSLVVWAHRWEAPRPLLPATRQVLACCYDIHDGFALAKGAASSNTPVK